MTLTKDWYKSRGMIGAAVATLSGIAGVFGVVVGEEEQIALIDLVLALLTAGAGIMAWIGRRDAKAEIL